MSRSHNQTNCGRGCGVCGPGELDNERYRIARESELLDAGLDDGASYLDGDYYGVCQCRTTCERCDPSMRSADDARDPLRVTFGDLLAERP